MYVGNLLPVCSFILEDFQKFNIDVSLISEHAQCFLPASTIISNITTGSRTILHMNRFGLEFVCMITNSLLSRLPFKGSCLLLVAPVGLPLCG